MIGVVGEEKICKKFLSDGSRIRISVLENQKGLRFKVHRKLVHFFVFMTRMHHQYKRDYSDEPRERVNGKR